MDNPEKPKLRKLKSWETEILISGGALFSIIQLKGYVFGWVKVLHFFLLNSKVDYSQLAIPVMAALGILILSFGLHLILRGFWFSLFLLDTMFPQGINLEKLKLKESVRYRISTSAIHERVGNLNQFCISLFSWSFASSAMFLGLAIPMSIIFLFTPESNSAHGVGQEILHLVFALTIGSFSLFMIDLIFFRVFSRIKIVSRIFFPIYWFWNKIALGFIWRPSLQAIFTNISNRFIFHALTILIIVVGFFYAVVSESNIKWDYLWENFGDGASVRSGDGRYLDTRPPDFWGGPAIQADVITDNFLKIKVPKDAVLDSLLKSLKTKKYHSDFVQIRIDDSTYTNLKWVQMDQVSGQQMIQTVTDIRYLKNGYHDVRINYVGKKGSWLIPFWKE